MKQVSKDLPELLVQQTEGLGIAAVLQLLESRFPGSITCSTSFSNEDQVITHQIRESGSPISLFTLDTGRLFQATYEVWQRTQSDLGVEVTPYYPDIIALQAYVQEEGPDAFYRSAELRKECCRIRKVIPLKQALAGKSIWVTGLRAGHSANRQDMPPFEWDEQNNIIKYHPLLHWTTEQVDAYVKAHHLPYNNLYDKGFASIGCEPCTRAIRPGEDLRAGRWWWEDSSKKECGLHIHTTKQTQNNIS